MVEVINWNKLAHAMCKGHIIIGASPDERKAMIIKILNRIAQSTILTFQEVGKHEMDNYGQLLEENGYALFWCPTTDMCSEDKREFYEGRDGNAPMVAIPTDKYEVKAHKYVNLCNDSLIPKGVKCKPFPAPPGREPKGHTIDVEWLGRISPVVIVHIVDRETGEEYIIIACHFPCTFYCRAVTNMACRSLDIIVQNAIKEYGTENVIIGADTNFSEVDPFTGEESEAYKWMHGEEFKKVDDFPWEGFDTSAPVTKFKFLDHGDAKTSMCNEVRGGKEQVFADSIDHVFVAGSLEPVKYLYYSGGDWNETGMVQPGPTTKGEGEASDHCPVKCVIKKN